MNRRSFLGFLSVAPVALPMAAKAMANAPVSPFASGGIVRSPQLATIGECGTEAFVPLRRGRIPVRVLELIEIDPDQDYTFVPSLSQRKLKPLVTEDA